MHRRGERSRLAGCSNLAEWRERTVAATWGWGLLAAIVAAIVYWPWFEFVESHGGYRRSWHTNEAIWAACRPGLVICPCSSPRAIPFGRSRLARVRRPRGRAGDVDQRRATCARLASSCAESSSRRLLSRPFAVIHRIFVVGRPGLDCVRALCRAGGLATKSATLALRRLGGPVGPDSVLSSLCPALAAGRGVRVALSWAGCSSRFDRESKSPAEHAPMDTGTTRPTRSLGLRLFACCRRRFPHAFSGAWTSRHGLAGTERLVRQASRIDTRRASART